MFNCSVQLLGDVIIWNDITCAKRNGQGLVKSAITDRYYRVGFASCHYGHKLAFETELP